MRQFLGLLAFALPSTLVWYALGALLSYKLRLTKATKIVGFFVAWLITPIAALLMADKPTVFSAQQEMHYAGAISVIVVIALLWITRIVRATITDKALKSESHHNKSDNQSQPIDNETYSDEKYYSIALKELQVNKLSSGLWGKALAYSDGDHDKAKSYYLKERAKQLMQMHQEKLNESAETFTPIIESDKKSVSTPTKVLSIFLIIGVIGVIGFIATDQKSSLERSNTETQKVIPSSTESAQDMFQRANDLSKQGRRAEALPLYQYLAEQGNTVAQRELAVTYLLGIPGVTQDYSQAVYWERKGAEQGDPLSQSGLGYLYEKGQGVAQDYNQAAYWYKKAAEQGDAKSQASLGVMYVIGQGVTKDYNQAVYWLRKAAEQGNDKGQMFLGLVYYGGNGVAKDDNQAVYWLRKAAEQGNVKAIEALNKLGLVATAKSAATGNPNRQLEMNMQEQQDQMDKQKREMEDQIQAQKSQLEMNMQAQKMQMQNEMHRMESQQRLNQAFPPPWQH